MNVITAQMRLPPVLAAGLRLPSRRSDHPYFTACQYHPEFLSRPGKPHPLFRGLIQAAQQRREGGAQVQQAQATADGVPLQV